MGAAHSKRSSANFQALPLPPQAQNAAGGNSATNSVRVAATGFGVSEVFKAFDQTVRACPQLVPLSSALGVELSRRRHRRHVEFIEACSFGSTTCTCVFCRMIFHCARFHTGPLHPLCFASKSRCFLYFWGSTACVLVKGNKPSSRGVRIGEGGVTLAVS